MLCGTDANVGNMGDVNWDSAKVADSKYLSFGWPHKSGGVTTNMRCYFGMDKDKTDAGKVNLPAFRSPVNNVKVLSGWTWFHTDKAGASV